MERRVNGEEVDDTGGGSKFSFSRCPNLLFKSSFVGAPWAIRPQDCALIKPFPVAVPVLRAAGLCLRGQSTDWALSVGGAQCCRLRKDVRPRAHERGNPNSFTPLHQSLFASITGLPAGVMLTIDITSLETGIHHLEFSPSASQVNLDPSTFGNVQVDIVLQYHRDRILVKMHATATATLTCDRTLQSYDEEIEGAYNVLFGPSSMVGQEGEEFEEVRPLDPSDREIDLTDVVRDTLLLSIPQRRIAPGAEEEPISREFGKTEEETNDDEPVDPRWSDLKELKDGE